MSSLLAALLFAAAVSAQITTSFWAPVGRVGVDRLGFYGSVVNANSSHTTLALQYDNGTASKIPQHPREQNTVIVGPTVWQDVDHVIGPLTASDADGRTVHCELNTASNTGAAAICTASLDPAVASRVYCDLGDFPSTSVAGGTYVVTRTRTRSERTRNSASVEVVTRTVVIDPFVDGIPRWCTGRTTDPSGRYVRTRTLDRTDIRTYQVVITAGQEKLSATQGVSGTLSGPVSTGSGGVAASTGSAATPQATNAAAPMVTMGPKVMGLGVAVAAMVL